MDEPTTTQYSGPATTATSASEGRLKVDAGKGVSKKEKKHALKRIMDKVLEKVKTVKMKMK